MFRKCVRIAMAVCALVSLVVPALADKDHKQDSRKFETVDLPDLAPFCVPLGINNRGDIVGYYFDAYGLIHGFVRSDGKAQTIDFPNALMSGCGGITDDGTITGVYFDFLGFQHGYGLSKGRFFSVDNPAAVQTTGIDFELGPGLGTAVFGINNRKAMVGEYADAAGVAHGFLYAHDKFTPIDFPNVEPIPGFGTNAISINDNGDIVGVYYTSNLPYSHGFLLQGGTFTSIDFPGSGGFFGTQTNGLNNQGDIVGVYSDPMDNGHGFLIHKGEYITIDFPDALFTECHSINDKGVITGLYYDVMGNPHGFITK